MTAERARHGELTGGHGLRGRHEGVVELSVEHDAGSARAQGATQGGIGGVTRHGDHDCRVRVGVGERLHRARPLRGLASGEQHDDRAGVTELRRLGVAVGAAPAEPEACAREQRGGQGTRRPRADHDRHRRGPRREG